MLNNRLTAGIVALSAVLCTAACTPPEPETTADRQLETTEDSQPAPPEENTLPEAATTPEPTETAPAEGTTPSAVSPSGTFASGEHATQGTATLVSQEDTQTLTLDEAFSTSDGPDLVVVLHRSATVLEETTPPAFPLAEGD
ncbi:MAG: DM13 domain-containing protein, partial [Cyanobacteria bacterium J06559_3]